MNELTQGVSWAGVAFGFLLSFALGWLWYSPKMFGQRWSAGVRLDLKSAGQMPAFAMATQALGTLALSWLVGVLAARDALLSTLLVFAMLMLLIVSNGKYAQKSDAAVGIEAGYILCMGLIMVLGQALF